MQIVFVHQNFPAQFGHIADYLVREHGHQCVFVSNKDNVVHPRIRYVRYTVDGGATKATHYCSRTFENYIWHGAGVYKALAPLRDIRPDLVVGHSGMGAALYLKDLYSCPLVKYFEYFYHPRGADMDFRKEFPVGPMDGLRARTRNAMILLDLHYADRGYSPTQWQHSLLPSEYKNKVDVIFDGVETRFWKPGLADTRRIGDWIVPEDVKIVTYATRGMESMRGFDIFMETARRICLQRNDVHFFIAGQDRVAYGGDLKHTGGKSFKDWILSRAEFDLSRFHFLGLVPPADLAKLFCLSDLHIYLTAPFVLSWSVINALSCGATMLASDTAPVREVIQHEKNGLLVDFFDIDGFVKTANKVLDDPKAYKHLGQAGRALVEEKYSYDACLPRIKNLYESVAKKKSAIA